MIKYNHDTNEWEGLTLEYIQSLEKAYPSINVTDILKHKMPCWIRNNPRKGKKKAWGRFINTWLSRSQAQHDELKLLRGEI
jgi:hypothetical protein